jgi:hypothetical protein
LTLHGGSDLENFSNDGFEFRNGILGQRGREVRIAGHVDRQHHPGPVCATTGGRLAMAAYRRKIT